MTSKLQKAHYFGIPSPATARPHHSATDSVEVIVLAAQEAGNDDPTAWILSAGNLLFISYCSLLWACIYIYCIFTSLTVFISGRVFPGLVPGRVRGPGVVQLGVPVEEHDGPQQHAVHHRQHQPDLAHLDREHQVRMMWHLHLLNIYNEPSTPGN